MYWFEAIMAFILIAYIVIGILGFIIGLFPWSKLFTKRSKCSRCSQLQDEESLKEFKGKKYCGWCLKKTEIECEEVEKGLVELGDDRKSFDGICEICKQYCQYVFVHEGKNYCVWCSPILKRNKNGKI